MKTIKWDLNNKPDQVQRDQFACFLHQHLDEFTDEKNAIEKCIKYTFNELNQKQTGGFIISLYQDDTLIGLSIINETGMQGYIPENILVYIAVHKDYRAKGLGKALMNEVISNCKGDIALHVEKDNPAKYLYEKLGFTNKYLEMRLNN
ncbi:GNAT family N-acetyltransferase [Myroides sp. LJL119]